LPLGEKIVDVSHLRLHRHQDSHLRCDLDHDLRLKKPRIIATGSGWRLWLWKVIFIVAPEALLSYTTHVEDIASAGISTKHAGVGCCICVS